MKNLRQCIEQANDQGRIARIPFVTAGFPDVARFFGIVSELDANGADIIEIGVPFSDPVADGPVVEAASRRALAQGVNVTWLLEKLKRLRPVQAGLALMGYYNPFLQYGLERLAKDACEAGVSGCIVPDLPLDEAGPLRAALSAQGLDLIALVGPNTSDERMREYAASASGYVYVTSVMGTTGTRRELPEAAETVHRARAVFSLPVALGFGVSGPEQIAGMPTPPHAVVFGSALLRHLDANGAAGSFMRTWIEKERSTPGFTSL
jgi:tryptophan synthase alpha chain